MSSMRTLRRRLDRWDRYARRTYWAPHHTRPAWMSVNTVIAPGHQRAWDAYQVELERRQCRPRTDIEATGQCCCAGCIGMGPCALDPPRALGPPYEGEDDDGCCALGKPYGHEGPCQWWCSQCAGTGQCWACDGDGDDGSGLPDTCTDCGGSGNCPFGCDEGWQTDDAYIPPPRMQTITVARGVL